MKRSLLSVLFVLLASMLVSASVDDLFAQAVFGNISGTVLNATGAAVANASILIKDVDCSTEYHTSANGQGEYTQGQLLAGHYQAQVTSAGFGSSTSVVNVHVDATVKFDAVLQVGAESSSVEVTDQTPLLQVDRAEVSTTLTASEVENLPVFDRNATGLVFTSPGTTLTGFQHSAAENAQGGYQFATNGQQFFANGFS